MAAPVIVKEISVTPAGRERRRTKLRRRAFRWATIIITFSALIWVPHAWEGPFVVVFGPWLSAEIAWARGSYLLSVAMVLLGFGSALLLPAAWILLTPRKSIVLFLRRFRLESVSESMSQAIEHGIGRDLRIVTLDDRSFKSLEAPAAVRRFSRWTGPAMLAVLALIILAGVILGASMFARHTLSLTGLGVMGLMIIQGTFLFVGPMVLPLLLYVVIQFGLLLALRRRVRKRGKLVVGTPTQLSELEDRLQKLGSRWHGATILEPQATVVEVTDALWKEAVLVGINKADWILVDVSQATDNLVWELENVLKENHERVLFTAEQQLFESWAGTPAATACEARTYALLADQEILGYRGKLRRDRKSFRKSLTLAIDNMGSRSAITRVSAASA